MPARLIRQRAWGDCGTAALTMLLGATYEDVYLEVARIDPVHRGKRGLLSREVILIAARLGIRLTLRRTFDLDQDEGIVRVRPTCTDSPLDPQGHFVWLADGWIQDPQTGWTLRPAEYLARSAGRASTLLQVGARF